MSKLRPFYEDVQAHYDLSNDFYRLFLDESMTYSCAYFERDDMSLAEAQLAKVDLALGKCEIQPGMRLLDIGCGWGTTALRAADKYGARSIGLTLSKEQYAFASSRIADRDDVEFRLQGWEEFDEPVDRIVSIGAFEHFRIERYPEFFKRCRAILPDDGVMLLHTIVHGDEETLDPGLPEWDPDFTAYLRFISKRIFPGGQIPSKNMALLNAKANGFECTRIHSLRLHYARTLDCWAENLQAKRDEAIAVTSEEVYDTYVRYLTECAHYFRIGRNDIVQFTLKLPGK